jgi:hypothetical protein
MRNNDECYRSQYRQDDRQENKYDDRRVVEVIRRNQKMNSGNIDVKDYFDHGYIRNPNVELRARNTYPEGQAYNIDNSRIGLNADPGNIQAPHQNFHALTHRTTVRRERTGQQLDPNYQYKTPYQVQRWNLDKNNNPHNYATDINVREQELQNNYHQRVKASHQQEYDEGYMDQDGNYVVGKLNNKNDGIINYNQDQINQTNYVTPNVPTPPQNCTIGSFPDCTGKCVPAGSKPQNLYDCLGNCYNIATDKPKGYVDCMGNCIVNGKAGATVDCKGICVPIGTTPTYELDCGGTCYNIHTEQPTSVPDCLGHCSKVGEGAIPGCDGKCGSNYTLDCLGNCVAPGKGATLDCNNDCSGRATLDCGNVCTKHGESPKHQLDCSGVCYLTSGPPPHVRDCTGTCVLQGQETSFYDKCGHCIPKGQGHCGCDKNNQNKDHQHKNQEDKEDKDDSRSSSSESRDHEKHKHHHKAHDFRQEVNTQRPINRNVRKFGNKND